MFTLVHLLGDQNHETNPWTLRNSNMISSKLLAFTIKAEWLKPCLTFGAKSCAAAWHVFFFQWVGQEVERWYNIHCIIWNTHINMMSIYIYISCILQTIWIQFGYGIHVFDIWNHAYVYRSVQTTYYVNIVGWIAKKTLGSERTR